MADTPTDSNPSAAQAPVPAPAPLEASASPPAVPPAAPLASPPAAPPAVPPDVPPAVAASAGASLAAHRAVPGGPDLGQQVTDLRDALKRALRQPERARKALDALAKPGALGRVDAVESARKTLQKLSLAAIQDDPSAGGTTLDAARQDLVGDLGHHLSELRRQARGLLLRDLSERARAQGLAMQVLTDKPLEVQLSPFTVQLDLAAGEARVRYARETVFTCAPEAPAILRAWADAKARIKADALEPERFFDLLRQAYEVVRRARGLAPGDRVDLVDLAGPLALLRVGPDAWRKTPLGKVADFPRYLLAYQLVHLRRAGLLSHRGLRVDLGTATGGSTRDKRGVLFLPSSATEGQYHLSIRFAPA